MTEDDGSMSAAKAFSQLGASKGGKARAEKLTPEERSRIAREAIEARWAKAKGLTQAEIDKLPKATHKGVLKIGDMELECYVLEDGRRVLHQRGLLKALGMARGGSSHGGDRLAKFVGGKILKPYDKKDLSAGTRPFLFRTPRGPVAIGFEATILADICEIVLDASDAGVLQKQQLHIAQRCSILHRGFARVGITALVDEATGYEKDKVKSDLLRILEAYIAKELLPWTKRFPDEFYEQMFRLKGWEYPPRTSRRPKLVGKLTEQLIYKRLPLGVLEDLRSKNPVVYEDGSRKHRHHQLLTEEIGNPHLEKQVIAVTTLMRVSRDWSEFRNLFARSDPTAKQQGQLSFDDSEED